MTSNTTPEGEVVFNFEYLPYFHAWWAFDDNLTTLWSASTGPTFPNWIGYKFPSSKHVVFTKMVPNENGGVLTDIKDYEIHGSNDDFATYDVLATGTVGSNIPQNTWITNVLNNNNSYRSYRVYVLNNYRGGGALAAVKELQFYGRADV